MKNLIVLALFFTFGVIAYPQKTDKLLTKEELKKMKEYTSLEEALKEPEKVYILSLGENIELTKLPKNIGDLVNLQIFSVGGNHLTSLPKSIGNLKKLQIFSLGGNDLEKLPRTIGKLENLQEIYLWGNKFTPKMKKKIQKKLGNDVSILF